MTCSHYHASLSQQEREEVQAAWTHDRVQIIVATIAFGMGAGALAWLLQLTRAMVLGMRASMHGPGCCDCNKAEY